MNKHPNSSYIVRFGDCDLFGHLNNARYIDYFLNAREDHLRDHYQLNLSTYYKLGVSWLVGSHEINYLRPALYNEQIVISSALISAGDQSLLVELQMMNVEQTQLKAVMWTRFIPVNVQTGKKSNHPVDFMDFAKSIEVPNSFVETGLKQRVVDLIIQQKSKV
jgi:acyl-CoA thioester hydrolase